MKHVLIFSHTDLDGIGGIIVSKRWAEMKNLPYEYYKCNYSEINDTVTRIVDVYEPSEIHSILISDISVNEEVAEMLDGLYKAGVHVILCDHHETALWLNKYDWAFVAEKDKNGVLRCGTYWMAKQFPKVEKELHAFIKAVDAWDTWKWKESKNVWAKNLNSLLSVRGARDFIAYIDSLDLSNVQGAKGLFTDYAKAMVETYDKMINSQAWKCENAMWTADFSVPVDEGIATLKGGIVFCNQSISAVADYILDRHPELDFIMLVALPSGLSFRSQKDLPVPLGELANLMTGNGGGHPYAAGSLITPEQFQMIFTCMVNSFGSVIKVDNLVTK